MSLPQTVGFNFLYAVLNNQDRVALNRAKEEHFHSKKEPGCPVSEREFLNLIRRHVTEFRTMPDESVLRRWGIAPFPTSQPVVFHVQEMKKRTVYRAYKAFQASMEALVINRDGDALDVAYDHISNFKESVAAIQVADRYKDMSEIGTQIRQALVDRQSGIPEVFVPFGWPTLDSLTGGAAAGDLVFFVGRPGMGKSNVLTQSALHAHREGKSVLFMSMEMTDLQISRRIYGSAGGFNWDKLRRGEVTEELLQSVDTTIEEFNSGAPFRIVSNQDKQTVDTVTALVDELSPDVVYIDAGYLMSVANSNAKAWEKLTVISEGLKRMASSRGIPVIISVQFNREASKGKRFELDTIAGSDAIGQLGSIIVAITEGEEPHKDTRRKLTIVKNREGGVDSFQIFNEFDPPNFGQVVDPIGAAADVFSLNEDDI